MRDRSGGHVWVWDCSATGSGGGDGAQRSRRLLILVRRLRYERPQIPNHMADHDTDSLLPPPTPFRSLILPPLLLSLLAPVLGTLTSATTSDTIWPLAGGLFFVHLLLSDFSTGKDARLRRWQRQKRAAAQRKRRSSLSQYDTPIEEKR